MMVYGSNDPKCVIYGENIPSWNIPSQVSPPIAHSMIYKLVYVEFIYNFIVYVVYMISFKDVNLNGKLWYVDTNLNYI